ncbi:MAG: hypothetical protein ABWZ82_07105 [Candidatus Limnocylindrales bacterium]
MRSTHHIGRASAPLVAILALMLALVAVVPVAAQDEPAATPDPGLTIDPGIPGEPGGPGEEPEPPFADGATPIVPEDGLNDIIEVPWDHITVGPDGRSLTVYFWSGAEGCYGLAGVEVDETGAVPVITLQTGTRPGVDVCVALAQLYSTPVVLEDPIIGGGVQ